MKGYQTLWMPGTDHAGIATQTVVDKRLQTEGQPALKDYSSAEASGDPGREEPVAKVQEWKDEYEAVITDQAQDDGLLLRLGPPAPPWTTSRARAVREAFFQLFKDG